MNDTPTPRATGRLQEGGPTTLVFERRFAAPIAEVWAELTESARLERWAATWTGDPASGHVSVTFVAEGDVAAEEWIIRECSPPHRLVVGTSSGDDSWHLTVELAEVLEHAEGAEDAGGTPTTVLTFGHQLADASEAATFGAGWDYYLDRLVVAQKGGEASGVDWNDYSPALDDYYARLGPRTTVEK
jgi:uncharacterized protein YndB with AHSA1/START domain